MWKNSTAFLSCLCLLAPAALAKCLDAEASCEMPAHKKIGHALLQIKQQRAKNTANAHTEPETLAALEKTVSMVKADVEICHGCWTRCQCNPDMEQRQCQEEGWIWHSESLSGEKSAEGIGFNGFDCNNDGDISASEMKDYLEAFGMSGAAESAEDLAEQANFHAKRLKRRNGPSLAQAKEGRSRVGPSLFWGLHGRPWWLNERMEVIALAQQSLTPLMGGYFSFGVKPSNVKAPSMYLAQVDPPQVAPDTTMNMVKADVDICHGCWNRCRCDTEVLQPQCQTEGGIWHSEAFSGEKSAEGIDFNGFDCNEDGDISASEMKDYLEAFGMSGAAESAEDLAEQANFHAKRLKRRNGPSLVQTKEGRRLDYFWELHGRPWWLNERMEVIALAQQSATDPTWYFSFGVRAAN